LQFHDLIIGVVAFCSELLGTVSGFGSSTFFVPIATFFETFQVVMALTAILHCFSNTWKLYFFREKFSAKLFVQLAIPSIVFTGVGAIGATYLPVDIFKKCLAVVLVLAAVLFLMKGQKSFRVPLWVATVLSAISGFATGLVGTGGAVRAVVLAGLNLEKNAFVFMSSSIDFLGDFVRMIVYLKSGFMDWSQRYYLPILGIMAYLGTRSGKIILSKIKPAAFEKIVALLILLGGIAMLF
jgi:uncharacterized membrane protein YfcA